MSEAIDVFLSHSKDEERIAAVLKDLMEEAYSPRLKVFASSDHRSISSGEKWFEVVLRALKEARAAVVLLSPVSANSRWIHFECGAFGQQKPVFPICHSGMKRTDLPIYLSKFQGPNLTHPSELLNFLASLGAELGASLKRTRTATNSSARRFAQLEAEFLTEIYGAHSPALPVDRRKEILSGMLEVTARALIHPRALEDFPIRTACRVISKDQEQLEVWGQWAHPFSQDHLLPIRLKQRDSSKFVIVKAIRSRQLLVESLPENHVTWYRGPHAGRIWPDLRCVLAVPILSKFGDRVMGVISFDSSRPLEETGFATDAAKTLATKLADLLSESLSPIA